MDREMTGLLERKSVQHGLQLVASAASKAMQARCAANAKAVGKTVIETAHQDSARKINKARHIRRKIRTIALITVLK